MRYLVLIPSDGPLTDIRYRELRTDRELRDGDEIYLDELLMRVREVLTSDDDQHDAWIVCRPDGSV